MQYKRTVASTGVQLPRWFQVERKVSVVLDVSISCIGVDRAKKRTDKLTVIEGMKQKDALAES
jgi:hypothetical protein